MLLADLDPDAPVVRGGSGRDPAPLFDELTDQERDSGQARLSVFIKSGYQDADQAVLAACVEGPVMHGKVQVALVRDLLEEGFLIADERADDEAECHYHVHFPMPVADSQVQAWLRCFSEPFPNPAKSKR